MSELRPLEFCRVCRLWRRFGLFQQNGFTFKCCCFCGDGSNVGIEEEAS